MKQFFKEFFLRAFVAAGGGPVVLAIIYGILGASGAVDSLDPKEVCLGILSVTFLAAIVGGMSAVYKQEQLPLPMAISIHCISLYLAYVVFYLINGWLKASILTFSAIFFLGYGVVWLFIYFMTKAKTAQLNRKLQKQ